MVRTRPALFCGSTARQRRFHRSQEWGTRRWTGVPAGNFDSLNWPSPKADAAVCASGQLPTRIQIFPVAIWNAVSSASVVTPGIRSSGACRVGVFFDLQPPSPAPACGNLSQGHQSNVGLSKLCEATNQNKSERDLFVDNNNLNRPIHFETVAVIFHRIAVHLDGLAQLKFDHFRSRATIQ